MKAIILCGGFATRLEPITKFVPKPLLPIGGKPILDYILTDLSADGLDEIDIHISTNHKFYDQFDYYLDHRKEKLKRSNIRVCKEPSTHNGNKFGAIKGILHTINTFGIDDDVIIIAGDNFYDFTLKGCINDFMKDRQLTICVHPVGSFEEAKRFGVVEMEGDFIKAFHEKPPEPVSKLISTGIYLIPREYIRLVHKYIEDKNNPDAPGFFIQWLVNNGTNIKGYKTSGKWFDIGTLATYEEVFKLYEKDAALPQRNAST
jgi:glucose-1-phosphate thymidylyltransferase